MLSCRGLAQAERLADRLGDSWFDAVYSGPERRAQQTARIVAGAGRRSVHVLAALMDIEFDAGRSIPGARLADYARRFAESPRWDSLPGFESRRQFRRRALQAIERILAGHPAGRVVLVSHASVINAFLSMLLGIAADRFFTPEHASISIVRWRQGRYAVRCLNDSSHLSPRPGISAPGELFTVR
jgi:probable phosphoglycerate mutase